MFGISTLENPLAGIPKNLKHQRFSSLKDGSSQSENFSDIMAEHDLAGPFAMIDSINHMKVSTNHFFGTHKWNQLVWVRFEAKSYC